MGVLQSKDFPQDDYIFTNDISNYTIASSGVLDETINTWHLTKIESPNGDVADLLYSKEESYMFRRTNDEENPDNMQGGHINRSTKTRVTQYQLAEIRYDYSANGFKKIVFEATDNRLDIRQDGSSFVSKELDAIISYDRHGKLISRHQLYHSYSNSTDTSNYHELLVQLENSGSGPTNSSSSKRLVLDSIVEHGRNGAKKPPHKFFYSPTPLPNKFSNSQDYWGYYNGAPNGRFLTFFGKSRIVDTIASEAAMLKKITYPTGGSTRFTYEHNRGFKGPEYDNIVFPDINPIHFRSVSISHLASDSYDGTAYVKDFSIGGVPS